MKNILFAALLFTAACTTKEPTPAADSTNTTVPVDTAKATDTSIKVSDTAKVEQ